MIIFIKNTSFWCPEHIIENLTVSPYRANFWIGFCIIFKIRQNATKCPRTGGPVGADPPSSHHLNEVGDKGENVPLHLDKTASETWFYRRMKKD